MRIERLHLALNRQKKLQQYLKQTNLYLQSCAQHRLLELLQNQRSQHLRRVQLYRLSPLGEH